MKLLLVIPTLESGGAEKVTITLANALSAQHEVTLFVMLDRGNLFHTIDEKVRLVRGVARGNTLWKKWIILRKLWQEARHHDVVIGAMELTATYFAYAAAWLTRKPLIAWIHTLLDEYLDLNYFSVHHRKLCRWMYRRIPHHVFVSEGAKASMLRVIAPNIQPMMNVIYNPMVFTSPEIAVALPEKPFILAVGRLAPEKGFAMLMAAFAQVRELGNEVALVILGEGPLRAALLAQAKKLGVQSNVHLPGFVANVGDYYTRAAVFAMSSQIEGLSMALVEAMQSGAPIVTTDIPAVHELLNGLIHPVRQGDTMAFAMQLHTALNTEEAISLKQQRIEIAERFTPEYARAAWEQVLKKVVL